MSWGERIFLNVVLFIGTLSYILIRTGQLLLSRLRAKLDLKLPPKA